MQYLRIINNLIHKVLIGGIFIFPLYFAFLYKDFSVISLDRAALFRIIVEVLIILEILKIIFEKRICIYVPRKFIILILAFFAAYGVATIFSVDPYISFMGSYWRQYGLITQLHIGAFIWILAANLKGHKSSRDLLTAMAASAVIVSVYGILQWLGLDLYHWAKEVLPGTRISSTFGSPVFLANYLAITIFITVYLINLYKNIYIKLLLSSAVVLQMACFLFTYTRGAWIGSILAPLLVGVSLIWLKKVKFKKKPAIVMIFALVIIITISLIPAIDNPTYSPSGFFIYRLKSIFDIESGSLALRLKYWTSALSAIYEKPILGYGPENGQAVFTKYYQPEWAIYEVVNSTPDKAHNELLDLLITGGLLLLGCFLALIFYIFFKWFAYTKHGGDQALAFLATAIMAFLLAVLFSFSTIETIPFFWIAAVILILEINKYKETRIFVFPGKKLLINSLISAPLILLIFYMIFQLNIRAVLADHYFYMARYNYATNQYAEMYNYYIKAALNNPSQEIYRWYYLNDAMQTLRVVKSDEYRKLLIEYIDYIVGMDKNKKENYPRILQAAKYYEVLGLYQNEKYFANSEALFVKLINLSPNMPDSYLAWAQMYYDRKQHDKSLIVYQACLNILPDINSPYLNSEHRQQLNKLLNKIYLGIAENNWAKNDNLNTEIALKNALKYAPGNLNIYKNLGELNRQQKNYDESIKYYSHGWQLDPRNYNWLLMIAQAHYEKNDKVLALEFAERAKKLASNKNEIQQFIDKLNKR